MPSETVRRLADAYWEGVLRRMPTLATFYGDDRYDDRLPDVGPTGRELEQAELSALVGQLDRLDSATLEVDDRITVDMLRLSATAGLDALRFRLDELAVDQMEGPQVWLPELLNWQPLATPEQVDRLVARYRAFPAYLDDYQQNLNDGIRDGRTAPRIAVERVVGQLQALLATRPEDSALAAPEATIGDEQRRKLIAALGEAVYPAYARLLDFLGRGYLEHDARAEPGIWSVTDGDAIYRALARQHTTTQLTPDELHAFGREDLGRIQGEMRAIMARLGDASGDIRGFTERLIHDPANLPTSREEIVTRSQQLMARAREALPTSFGRLPRANVEVRPVEAYRERDTVAAFYYPPAADGSRPGIFYVNTFEPSSRPRHTLPALVFHESLPGHHLQIAIGQEAADVPAFRRLSAGALANAFVEGWGLYAERLADELGLYTDDQSRFGMLGYQAWRACRLVVDTGLHALHWSRDQAIQFFLDNVGLTERETVNEVDRYIIWPGQALAYKVGQREIERLRADTAARLGARFDLRAFHDALLGHAALPLSTMREVIGDRW
ncbi:MAG: DUF885 domain-containing protein [Chloroflexi bacterium]|nr:DUF885 domain-containing protein [Chloroflexota bacterium]